MKIAGIGRPALTVLFLVVIISSQFVITSHTREVPAPFIRLTCVIYIPWILLTTFVFGVIGTFTAWLISAILIPIIYLRVHLPYPFLCVTAYTFLTAVLYFFLTRYEKAGVEKRIVLHDLEAQGNNSSQEYHKRSEEIRAYKGKISHYSNLRQLGEKLVSTLSLYEAAHKTLQLTAEFIGKGDKTSLFLLDDNLHHFTLAHQMDLRSQGRNLSSDPQDAFNHWLLRNRQNLLVEDVKADFRFQDSIKESGVSSLIAAPLVTENKLIGAIRLESHEPRAFTLEDLRLLAALTSVTSTSLKNAHLYNETLKLSIKDGLTELFVPTHFHQELQNAFIQAKKNQQSLCVMMADLDDFKGVNDRFGHTVGDTVLKKVAGILAHKIDVRFIPTRYGGEEFSAFFTSLSLEEVHRMIEELRAAIAEGSLDIRREVLKVTLSIGLSNIREQDQGKDDLLHRADQALYEAKRSGKNRICLK